MLHGIFFALNTILKIVLTVYSSRRKVVCPKEQKNQFPME